MEWLYDTILFPLVLFLILFVGGYFLLRLKGFWLLHPLSAAHLAWGDRPGGDLLRGVTMALAGTLGVGNIVGVALGILVGGAGSVFWMVLTAFFAMAVKYAEVALSIHTREAGPDGWQGGVPYYMRGKGRFGGVLPTLFSLLCLVCALVEGCIIQANAVAESLSLFGVSPLLSGVGIAVLAAFFLLRGKEAVGRFTALWIPVATFAYFILCFGVIFRNLDGVPKAFAYIIQDAFRPMAGAGGILGFFTANCVREGTARGLLSNEAGCGTAPLAHVTTQDTTPVRQGLWGVFEVFLDTVVVCTMTALACLTGAPQPVTHTPFAYLSLAFSSAWGGSAPYLLAIILFIFAFSTSLAWSYYGISALSALTRRPLVHRIYLTALLLALPLGAMLTVRAAYLTTDILLALMCLINLPALLLRAKEICKHKFT